MCNTEGHWLALIHHLSERYGAIWVGSGPEGESMEWPARFPVTVCYEMGPGFRGNMNVFYTRFVYHEGT